MRVEVWRGKAAHLAATVRTKLRIADVVCQDEDNIRFLAELFYQAPPTFAGLAYLQRPTAFRTASREPGTQRLAEWRTWGLQDPVS